MIERSRVRVPAGAAGEFSSPESVFCADYYFDIWRGLREYQSAETENKADGTRERWNTDTLAGGMENKRITRIYPNSSRMVNATQS